jgi:hypothetical protein
MNAKKGAVIAIAIVIVTAGPALAFKVAGSEELPILQTDDGQTFPGWNAARDACFAEARSKPKPIFVGFNCNQSATYQLAEQEANRELQALSSDLRDGVESCISVLGYDRQYLDSVGGLSSFQRWGAGHLSSLAVRSRRPITWISCTSRRTNSPGSRLARSSYTQGKWSG